MAAKLSKKIQNRALSVRQPFAEQIIKGCKPIEFRSIHTNIRGRIYIYASKSPIKEAFERLGKVPGDLPAGVLIGTVEVIDCIEKPDEYYWVLANPKRLKKLIKPQRRPQPVWFKPFYK